MMLWYTQHYGQHAEAAAAAAAAAHMAGANAADAAANAADAAANAAAAAAHAATVNANASAGGWGSMQPAAAPSGQGWGLGSVLQRCVGFGSVAAPSSQHGGGNKVGRCRLTPSNPR